MKTCCEVQEKASALLDGELPLLQLLGVKMHLVLCRHCRRFMRHLRLVSHSLALRGRLASPTGEFVERVTEHLECQAEKPGCEHSKDTGQSSAIPGESK